MGILKFLKPFKWYIFAQIITSVIWAVDLSLRPYLVKLIINKISITSPENTFNELWFYICFYILLIFILNIIYRSYRWAEIYFISNLRKYIGTTLFGSTIRRSYDFFQNNFAGSIANKINNCVSFIPQVVKIMIDNFLRYGIALLIAIYTVWNVSIVFALGLIAWVSLFFIVSIFSAPKLKELSRISSVESSKGTGTIVDTISNFSNVRLFAREKFEENKIHNNYARWMNLKRNRDKFLWKIETFRSTSFLIFQAFCLYWLLLGISNGKITPGDFALILTINISIVDCLWTFSRDMQDFTEHLGIIEEGLKLISSIDKIVDAENAKELIITKGDILFDDVCFSYKNSVPLFLHKSIQIYGGQKVGLVGYSGSGKSSFINIILRLFDVNSGKILIDGMNIADVTQDSLRGSISLIPQDPSLFHITLMENIRYGNTNATDEDVIEASKKAFAHEFISNMKDGYNTLVGERGVKISGGQKQRIAIARAILKNAPILILDEATNQLDAITEAQIQESVWGLMKNKTSIVIAHRLSTLLHMDRILVIHKGKIVEDGTHTELIIQDGLYKSLWDKQIGGFLPLNS